MYNILFFDGECRYCNRWVQWIIDRDKDQSFRFASLQSDFAKEMFNYYHFIKESDSTIIVFINGQSGNEDFKTKSEAVLSILSILKQEAFIYRMIKFMPRALSDFGYDCIASVRKYIPVKDCRLYGDDEKRLFLNDYDFNEMFFRFSHKL